MATKKKAEEQQQVQTVSSLDRLKSKFGVTGVQSGVSGSASGSASAGSRGEAGSAIEQLRQRYGVASRQAQPQVTDPALRYLQDAEGSRRGLVSGYNAGMAADQWLPGSRSEDLLAQIQAERQRAKEANSYLSSHWQEYDSRTLREATMRFRDLDKLLEQMASGVSEAAETQSLQYGSQEAFDSARRRAGYYGKSVEELEAAWRKLGGERAWALTDEDVGRREAELSRALRDTEATYQGYIQGSTQDPKTRAELRKAWWDAQTAYRQFMDDVALRGTEVAASAPDAQWLRQYIDSGAADYDAGVRQYGVELDRLRPYEVLQWAEDPARDQEQRDWAERYMQREATAAGQFGVGEYRRLAEEEREYHRLREGMTQEQRDRFDALLEAHTARKASPNRDPREDKAYKQALLEYAKAAGISREEAARQFESVVGYTDYRSAQEQRQRNREYATAHPLSATAQSYATNLVGNPMAAAYLYTSKLFGLEPRSSSDWLALYNATTDVRQQVARDIESGETTMTLGLAPNARNDATLLSWDMSKLNTAGGQNVGSWLYNAVNSTIDSAITMTLTQGVIGGAANLSPLTQKIAGNVLTNAILGSGAALQEYTEAVQSGADSDQAALRALLAGGIEGMTEYVGGEAVWRNILSDKTALKAVLSSMLSEGTEEVASNQLTRMMRNAFRAYSKAHGGGSEAYELDAISALVGLIGSYEALGYGSEKAFQEAVRAALGDDLSSFLAGAFSGGLSTAGGRVIQSAATAAGDLSAGRRMIREGQRNAANVAEINALARDYGLDGRQTVTERTGAYKLGRAVRLVTESANTGNARQAVAEISSVMREQLEAVGYEDAKGSGSAARTAEAYAKQLVAGTVGDRVTYSMQQELALDEAEQRLLRGKKIREALGQVENRMAESGLDFHLDTAILETMGRNQLSLSRAEGSNAAALQKGQDASAYVRERQELTREARRDGSAANFRRVSEGLKTLTREQQEEIWRRNARVNEAELQPGQNASDYVEAKSKLVIGAKTGLTFDQVMDRVGDQIPVSQARAIFEANRPAAAAVSEGSVDSAGHLVLPKGTSTAGIAAMTTVYSAIPAASDSAREDYAIAAPKAYNMALDYGGRDYAADVLRSLQKAYPDIFDELRQVFDAGLRERESRGLNVAREAAPDDAHRQERKAGLITREDAERLSTESNRLETVDFERIGRQQGVQAKRKAQQTVRMAQRLSRALNVNIVFFDSRNAEGKLVGGANGFFDAASGTVYLDVSAGLDNGGSVTFTLAHELTHAIKARAEDRFQELEDFVVDFYYRKGGRDYYESQINMLLDPKSPQYDASLRDEADAREELVARSCENMLRDTQAIRTLYEQHRGLFGVISKAVDRFVRAFNKTVQWLEGDTRAASWYARQLAESRETMEELQKLWDAGLVAAAQRGDREAQENETAAQGGGKLSPKIGVDQETGRSIYKSNFPIGTPKAAKAQRILHLIQDVWSHHPITLVIENNEGRREIQARFDPFYDPSGNTISDASKLMGGNRHGSAKEQRVTLDLADDYYQIAQESIYNYSKEETGKDLPTHKGVQEWHYFIDDILFQEYDSEDNEPYRVTINVKERQDGSWVYSFNAERQEKEPSTRRTLHADVNQTAESGEANAQLSSPNIAEKDGTVKKFSMKAPVEETARLIALHNLNATKLQKALKLGGFPMPSIAVTKTDIPHTNFGDITLVMDKTTVDPQFDRRNTVYSADAWTPTFPAVEYEVNEKVASALRRRYYDLYKKYGNEVTRPLYPWANYADDELTRKGGLEKVLEEARDNVDMMKLYLMDTGLDVPEAVTEEQISRLDDDTIEFYDHFVKAMGREPFAELTPKDGQSPIALRREWWSAHGDAFETAYKGYMKGLGFSDEEISNVLENETVADQTRKALQIRNYIKNGPETRTVTTNTGKTNDAIRAAVDAGNYDTWLHELFDGLEKSSGIYNGRDRYTASGNLRSFAATHYPVTLENVAKAMAAENDGNSRNVDGFYGVKSLRAGMAKRFSSIAEMHQYEGRLNNLTEEEADAIHNALSDRLGDISIRIYDSKPHDKYDSYIMSMDSIGETLMEITEQKNITAATVQKIFAKYGYSLSAELAEDVRALLFDVSQMPVNIFEAKPERAVRFDEVLAAVVPSGTDSALLDGLRGAGVQNIIEYKAGNDADRMEKVNSVEGAKFSLKDVTDRQILSEALLEYYNEGPESEALQTYQHRIREMEAKQARLEEANAQALALKDRTDDEGMDERHRLQREARRLREEIRRYDAQILELEKGMPLRSVVTREREAAYRAATARADEKLTRLEQRWAEKLGAERARGAARLERYRRERNESAAARKYRGRIEASVKDLLRLVTENSDKRHVPDQLRQPLAEFLESLNLDSARAAEGGAETGRDRDWGRRFERLTAALNAQRADEAEGKADASLYLPDDFYELLNQAAEAVRTLTDRYGNGESIYTAGAQTLREISQVLQILQHAVKTANQTMVNRYAERISDLGEKTMEHLNRLGAAGARGGPLGRLNNLIFWQNGTPYYVFKRFGDAGFSTFQSIMDGQGKLAAIAEKIIGDSREMFSSQEVKDWQSEIHEVELSDGHTVRMTAAQLMSFYCLSKRQQALGHLLGGGMRIDAFKDGRRTVDDRTDYVLTIDDVQAINALLTDRQREAADRMQEYMSTYGSELGNEVTMRRYGYKAYGETNYFPIVSDRQNLDGTKEEEQRASLLRLLNMSHTKSLVDNANNALVVQNIFDVFSNHMSDMAEYNALALPVLDMVRWFNYKNRQRTEEGQVITDTVQKSLATAFGGYDRGGGNVQSLANSYVTTFLKDLNGNNERGRDIGIGNLMGRYKRASVAANLRVAIQQPMSIARASAVLDPKWIVRGIAAAAASGGEAGRELSRYSNEAKWKDQGHHDIYIGRSVAQQIKNDQGRIDWLVEQSMKAAELGDKVTWSALWMACKLEQQAQGLDGEELMEATARRFQEVVYATQVMDATTTRSQSMRSNSTMAQMWTAFMAEPTLSLNLLANTYVQWRLESRRGGDTAEARKRAFRTTGRTAVRAIAAYAVNGILVALAESLMDAFRDDDDYETFVDKYLQALGENWWDELDPLRKITVLKDIINLFAGRYGAGDRMDMAALVSAKKGIDVATEWYNVTFEGAKATETTYYGKMTVYGKIYQLLKATSQITGVPFAGLSREIQTIWNNMLYPGLKAVGVNDVQRLKTYDESARNVGIPKLYEALANGDESGAVKLRTELYYNGVSDEAVTAGLKEQIKLHYTAGDLEAEEAARLLVEYCGYDVLATGSDSIQYQLDKWDWNGEGNFKISRMLEEAFSDGDNAAVREAVQYYRTRYHSGDSSIKSMISQYWHERYTAKTVRRDTIMRMMIATGLYTQEDVQKKFAEWDKADAKAEEERKAQEKAEAAARRRLLGS